MKLRNKKTGEIFDYRPTLQRWNGPIVNRCNYNSLAELNEEWEDYEEPKDFWYIEPNGVIARIDEWDCCTDSDIEIMKVLGNYFETKEEAEKAVEKLKAFKRLKDKGFRFVKVIQGIAAADIRCKINEESEEVAELLDLLFGGEE